MSKECKICNNNKFVDIICTLDESNLERFKLFSLSKFNGYLHNFIRDDFDISIAFCKKCQFYWYINIPTDAELTQMYAQSNSINPNIFIKSSFNKNNLLFKRILKTYNSIIEKPDKLTNYKIKLLDFGSGAGEFSRIAVQNNMEVIAYDPSMNRNTLQKENLLQATTH